MSDPAGDPREGRVLILPPTARDGAFCLALLTEAGMVGTICADLDALCCELAGGAGMVILTEEALAADEAGQLTGLLRQQPAWLDLPLLILTRGGADSPLAAQALETLGNVTLLERPIRAATLISAVRAGLRARQRQYQIREHLAEREQSANALREADRRKDEFLAMLAHELRNPLAPIRNALHLLQPRWASDPTTERLGAMMDRQLSHIIRLVDDLLDVSRITRGKFELRLEPVDLTAIVTRAVEDVRPFLEERQHVLEVVLCPEPLRMAGDPVRLEQVLNNLLTNAGKYTPPGGLIQLEVCREGSEAVIRVRDNGIGIRPEALPRLFEMFMQADRVPGQMSEGLGLGLTLVKNLVEMHGGQVTAASAGMGRGSEFVIRLPLPAAPAELRESRPVAPSRGRRALRILVVDDNVDGAHSLAMILQLEGHEVWVAHEGATALETARAHQPELVLLDIGLPNGMDGYEVARRLREPTGVPGAYLVALTGYGRDEDRRRTAAEGFSAHLVKPVDPTSLAAMIENVQQRA